MQCTKLIVIKVFWMQIIRVRSFTSQFWWKSSKLTHLAHEVLDTLTSLYVNIFRVDLWSPARHDRLGDGGVSELLDQSPGHQGKGSSSKTIGLNRKFCLLDRSPCLSWDFLKFENLLWQTEIWVILLVGPKSVPPNHSYCSHTPLVCTVVHLGGALWIRPTLCSWGLKIGP